MLLQDAFPLTSPIDNQLRTFIDEEKLIAYCYKPGIIEQNRIIIQSAIHPGRPQVCISS